MSGKLDNIKVNRDKYAFERNKRKGIKIASSVIVNGVLILGAITMLMPFIWMISTSLKSLHEVFVFPPTFFGETVVWENFARITERFDFFLFFRNSLQVSLWIVVFQLFTSAMAGYAFAKLNFPHRDKVFLLYLASMMVPMHVTIIPNFLLMRMFGLVNTLWSLMIPPMVSAFGTFLLRQFFMTVPKDMIDAAKIDGCTPIGCFIRIALPMATPTLATLGIFAFMFHWNDYFTPLIYITRERYYTLPLGLASMQGLFSTDWPVLMAATTVSILPVLVIFLLAQDAFQKGIMLSGMKD